MGAANGSAVRSHLTITGAVAGVGILASSFVVAPPDSNYARTEVRAVQLASFTPRLSAADHPRPFVETPTSVALVPLDIDSSTDVATPRPQANNTAVVVANADGDIEDIFGQLGAFVGGWALLIGFVALAAVAVVFVAPVNFIVSLVQQLFEPQAAMGVARTAKGDITENANTTATSTTSLAPTPSVRATTAKAKRADARGSATPAKSALAKADVQKATPPTLRHSSRSATDQQRNPAQHRPDSAGPSAKGSGPSRHGSAKSSD